MAPTLTLKPGTAWGDAWQRCLAAAPEAFQDDSVLGLWDGTWHRDGRALPATTPVDGTPIAGPPRLDPTTAHQAVRASLDQHRGWRHIALPERPAGDVGDRAGQRGAALGHAVDLVDVPADAVDGPVHLGLGQPPGLADLPDQEEGEQSPVLAERVEGGGPTPCSSRRWPATPSSPRPPPTAGRPASPSPARSPPARASRSPSSAAAAVSCPRPWSARPRSAASPSSAAATPAPGSPPPSPTRRPGGRGHRPRRRPPPQR